MKVALITPHRFHTMQLANHLQAKGWLAKVFSGLPRSALERHRIEPQFLATAPKWRLAAFVAARAGSPALSKRFGRMSTAEIDKMAARWVAKYPGKLDLLSAYSGVGVASSRRARERGAKVICHRGSTHIEAQQEILAEEHERLGLPFTPFHRSEIERELKQYESADLITVPSNFARDSFIRRGVPASKVKALPYGVNTAHFHPVAAPDPDGFEVVFVGQLSVRKGIPYLLDAFARLDHPKKRLTLIGSAGDLHLFRDRIDESNTRILGIVPHLKLKEHLSRSDVFVLPSIEEGMANVMVEALACKVPVLATSATGAEDLYTDGVEGFIVPPRDAQVLADRLQQLADDKTLRREMAENAIGRIKGLGGEQSFFESVIATYGELLAK